MVEHALPRQPLELAVLILWRPRVPCIRHLYTVILDLQLVEGRRAQPILAANLRSLEPCLLLVNYADDLILGELTLHQIERTNGKLVSR